MQDAVLKVDQPKEGTPPFVEERAAGKARMWNFGQPHETQGKNQVFRPHLHDGTPDIRKGTNSDGSTLLSKFEDPVRIPDVTVGEHWFYKFKAYDSSKLPGKSNGPWAWQMRGEPDWMEMCHGLKIEGL